MGRRRCPWWATATFLSLVWPGEARSQFNLGGYSFPDRSAFADEVVEVGTPPPGGGLLPAGTTSVATALTDANRGTWVIAGGSGAGVDIIFVDNVAVNEPGPDIVVFESGSDDPWKLSVSKDGTIAGLTAPREVRGTQAIELDDFGIPSGGIVTYLRIQPNVHPGPGAGEWSAEIQEIGAFHSRSPGLCLIECLPAQGGGSDLISRGFYIPDLSGSDLSRVDLWLSSDTMTVYGFSLTARAGAYDGPVLGTASTTVYLWDDPKRLVPAYFRFSPPCPVTPGATVTFALERTSGPAEARLYYGCVPRGACPGPIQTQGRHAPLDTPRREGIPIRVYQSRAAAYAGFDFDDRTVQDWSVSGAFDEDGDGPFPSSFLFGWKPTVSWPCHPGLDDPADSNGSIQIFAFAGHGVRNPGATWWIMQFRSPDLGASPAWQRALGFSVEIAECMAVVRTVYANLNVRVYDRDQGRERSFYSGTAVALEHASYGGTQGGWNHLEFDWSGILPPNRTILQIWVNIWGRMDGYVEGGLYLDQVMPISGRPPAAPSDLAVAATSPQLHIAWRDNSDNESGFKLQRKSTSTIFWPLEWETIAILGPGRTSFQMDGPRPNHRYAFRVAAFNEEGESEWAESAVFTYVLSLQYIQILSPNGREILVARMEGEVTWTNGISPPPAVDVALSVDGGGSFAPLATSVPNTGRCVVRVPAAASGNCIVKVSAGSLYDLSDAPFAIVSPWSRRVRFERGDANQDGSIDIADAISILSYLFAAGAAPPCLDAADANDNETIEIGDAIWLLNALFAGGPAPPYPYGVCGPDPEGEGLDCASSFCP